MAFYADEEDFWKCPQHPTKRRRSGVCPTCLKDRLSALCPECGNMRPCTCCPTSSSSSSSSSSFSIYFPPGDPTIPGGRISTLIESEPPFVHRSRSNSLSFFPFFRSARFSVHDEKVFEVHEEGRKSSSSLWAAVFGRQKSRRESGVDGGHYGLTMKRSRSVAASVSAESEARSSSASGKSKGWYFPSPMKVFRHSKASKVVHERSPLHRG